MATVEWLLDRVKEITPILRGCAEEAEKARRLSRPVVDAMYETFRENWEAAVQGAAITLDRKLKMQLATTCANRSAAKAVDLVHDAAGASAIRNQYRFQR
jgi:hypothetical protein